MPRAFLARRRLLLELAFELGNALALPRQLLLRRTGPSAQLVQLGSPVVRLDKSVTTIAAATSTCAWSGDGRLRRSWRSAVSV